MSGYCALFEAMGGSGAAVDECSREIYEEWALWMVLSVYLPALLWIVLASTLTAPLGAKAAHRMKIELLRKMFAVLLVVLATKLLMKVL